MSPSFHTYLSATTASLAIAMAFASVPAHAQDRGTDNAAVETILITARKRVETLQNVPISVTAYSNAALEQRDITNLQGLNNFTPNLELTTGRADGGGSAAQIYIRGVGQSDFIFPNDPGVGLYVDDVYLARTVGGLIALADVERVEVLRGPQGTLYGKNTIGGAVKVITKAPTGEWGGKIRLTAGNFDRRDAVASVDVPILDTLAMRVELASLQRDGFVIRPFDGIDLGNEDKKLLRADMLWEPTPKLTVRMQGDVQSQRQNGAPGNLLTIIPSTAGATPVDPVNGQPVINPITNQQAFVPGTGIIEGLYNPVVVPGLNAGLGLPEGTLYDGRFVTGDARTSNGTAFVNDDNDIWGLSLNINYEISDNLSIKSITAYRNLDANFARDGDHTPYAIVDTNNTFQQEQISQEFQLSGLSFSDRFNWLVGGFAFFENASDDNTVSLLEGTLEAVGLELSLRPISSIKSQSFAIFTHGDFDVTDRLSISAGLRFTYEEKELQRIFTLRSSGVVITDRRNGNPDSGDPLAAVGPALEENWSAFAPKVGLDFPDQPVRLIEAMLPHQRRCI
ncbi:MAG: TonB-dependent receptor, partial [Pseudomonadota bacterium]